MTKKLYDRIERLERENIRLYNLLMKARGYSEKSGKLKRYKGVIL